MSANKPLTNSDLLDIWGWTNVIDMSWSVSKSDVLEAIATKEQLQKSAPHGGKARAEKLSAERRREIARQGGLAGGRGRKKK